MQKQDKFNLIELFNNIKLILPGPTFFYNLINFLSGENFD
jgi:hypothetical protein